MVEMPSDDFSPRPFLAVVAGWLFVKRLPDWIRSIRAAGWPTVEGKVETVEVKSFAEQSLAEIAYSYLVKGVRYSGYFSLQFADEQDAWSYVDPLKDQPLVVRCKPGAPGTSAIRLSEQSPLFNARPGNFSKRLIGRLFENTRK